jgi:DNA-binding Lrp family transcriptional regulator
MEALLFISIDLKKRTMLEQRIIKTRGVKRVMEILGQYDIAVEISADNRERLEELISKLSSIEGVDRIATYVISKEILPS